ncbi:hypothetical protein H6763_03455 [Candidatus Nomurabacteria bacterium]|uniref:Uncharacterized protein n=1 Tax=Candidatus Dojkabacteria bacterium TaxID=2099670 RepID=A0A955KXR1_9BACT|nr:hypothetical protein [Candidatus Dojkabacteria bacterium]MCB9789763.1 hypothetical protein [Candidatus Nomurabacteria bacterium]MCB9803860.1 hypothetical protein [Candidatus Nomurabacteria bacterium]
MRWIPGFAQRQARGGSRGLHKGRHEVSYGEWSVTESGQLWRVVSYGEWSAMESGQLWRVKFSGGHEIGKWIIGMGSIMGIGLACRHEIGYRDVAGVDMGVYDRKGAVADTR